MPQPPSGITAPVGTETILLVEDEPEVLAVAKEMLEECGYQVIKAETPPAALELIKQRSSTIHLLITDVVMPNMTGPELAGQVTTLRPGVKVLYLSGRIGATVVRDGGVIPGAALLHKPFTTDDLARKVREVLDSPSWPA
jgi:CheY-like chemotaxis protein